MKKIGKKLVLNKETLRTLTGTHLQKALGGMPPDDDTEWPSCDGTCSCECD